MKKNNTDYDQELELDYVNIWANAASDYQHQMPFSFLVITLIFNQFQA